MKEFILPFKLIDQFNIFLKNRSDMKKTNTTRNRIKLFSLLMLLLYNFAGYLVHGQEYSACKIPSPADVRLLITESGHSWQPPFGIERVGRSYDVIITIQSQKLPSGNFILASYSQGNELHKKNILFTNKVPFSGMMPDSEHAGQFSIRFVGNQAFTEKETNVYTGKLTLSENTDQVALIFTGSDKNPIELARESIKLTRLEAEAVARPDKIINPVDLGAILVPADWLLLEGGQKAYVTIAVLSRDNNIWNARAKAWYGSAPQNIVTESFPSVKGSKVQKEVLMPPSSKTLENDILHVSVEDEEGKELWNKQINVMIVQDHPVLPSFGAVKTKLRYDMPVLNIVNGKNNPIDYDKAWAPEFEDLVVCLPNGSRLVFWRGTSFIPVWAGKYNTCLSYEWAERLSPNVGFTDCPEPLMDKELRYSRVEIVESTNARIHIRWNYQSCDFNYKVNGDLPVEDYYFYPDGFGTRVLTLTSIPESDYEVSEFLVLSPPAAFPLDFLPFDPVDIISLKTGEKSAIHLPEWFALMQTDQTWKKVIDPSIYRVRLHKKEPLSAISFNPNLFSKPRAYGAFYDNGYIVSQAYWGGHWPLSRGYNTMWKIDESVWSGPSSNCSMTWATNRPKPIRSTVLETKDAFGTLKTMKEETWAWLIGMSDANDEELLQIAESFANPPALEIAGAKQDKEPYVSERRAMRLVVEKNKVTIMIKPGRCCVNPVFELLNAPKDLLKVKLGDRILPTDKYAWDGHSLWLNATIDKSEILDLQFK